MATEKQSAEKEVTVEEKLSRLYQLQTMVTEIDKIKTLRGELPLEVQDLEDEIAGLETRLQNYQSEIKYFETSVVEQKNKIADSTGLIEKYKSQLDNVRNNREFDNLSKEIEFSEKKIREFSAAAVAKREEIAQITETLDGRKADLAQKQGELEEIVSETKQEEEKLREKAKKLEASIEPRLLSAFKRIRKGARNGLAVVYIQRDACGGCFNKIPPQKQMDIKLRKKIIVCEYCGRIMIDPELAGVEV